MQVQRLGEALQDMGAMKPTGVLTEQLRREWRGSCTRLAQRLVTEAERATVLNALRTWGEVITFMQARSRPLQEVVDLDVFLHEGTAAPARATQSLRWLTKQARVDLGLGMLTPPAGQARRAGVRGQAAVVEPVMLLKMEQRMEEPYTPAAVWLSGLEAPNFPPVTLQIICLPSRAGGV